MNGILLIIYKLSYSFYLLTLGLTLISACTPSIKNPPKAKRCQCINPLEKTHANRSHADPNVTCHKFKECFIHCVAEGCWDKEVVTYYEEDRVRGQVCTSKHACHLFAVRMVNTSFR